VTLVVRPARPEDATTIHGLIVGLAEYEHEPDAVEVTPATLRAQLESPRPPFECLLAEVDGAPVGFALFFQSYSTWRGRPGLWLEDLFVLPAHRRRGIGRALLARLGALAAERGCARLEFAVLHWNAPAIAFYEALGAEPLGAWQLFRVSGAALERLLRGGRREQG
jgi:GNAT superfamily N-acetyltransferase